MNNEELIELWLEESHRRGRRETVAAVDGLVTHLRDRRWRRRANRLCNLLAAVFVVVVVRSAVTWIPSPEYDSYICTQAEASPEADCSMLHQILTSR